MGMYRKKPVVIEAVQVLGFNHDDVMAFCPGIIADGCTKYLIQTLEGNMLAQRGDWIIKGVKGEFYPCKPDIFEATYEEAVDKPAPGEADTGRGDAGVPKL
jgi:hypothetical protein